MNRPLIINFKNKNNYFCFSYFELFLIFVYAFLSCFEYYLTPFIGNSTKYLMVIIVLIFITKDLFFSKSFLSIASISLIMWLALKCLSIFIGGYNDVINTHLISQIGFVFFVIPFISHNYEKNDRNIILLFFWVASMLFNILSLIFKKPYLGTYTSRQVLTLFGQQWDPNNCAAASLVCFTISIYFLLYKRKYYISSFFGTIISFTAILISGSRGGILAAALLFLICFFVRKPLTRFRIILRTSLLLVLFVILLLLAIKILPPETIGRYFDIFSDGGSGRISLWKNALSLFKSRPLFGAGWGTATYYDKLFPTAVHNTFISMMAENGIVGLILFLFPYFYLLIKSSKKTQMLPILLIVSSLVPAFFIDSINKRFLWNGIILAYLAFSAVEKSKDLKNNLLSLEIKI